MLSIWTRTINDEKVDTCWIEAVTLQGQQGRSDGPGADVTLEEEEDDEAHRTCTTALKNLFRQDMPGEQQEVVIRLVVEQQEILTDYMADLSAYAQGVLLKVRLHFFDAICILLQHRL